MYREQRRHHREDRTHVADGTKTTTHRTTTKRKTDQPTQRETFSRYVKDLARAYRSNNKDFYRQVNLALTLLAKLDACGQCSNKIENQQPNGMTALKGITNGPPILNSQM